MRTARGARTELTRDDIVPMSEYVKIRKDRRREIVALKRERRMEIGPVAICPFRGFRQHVATGP